MTEFAWPYRADLPQRYNVNLARYHERGGTAQPGQDVLGFAQGGDGDIARFLAFSLAFDQIAKEGVAGDVAELGVFRGHTAHALAIFARRLGRHTYLFDTFTGFDPADFVGVDQSVTPGFGDTSLDAVRDFVGTERTTYCAGHFPGTTRMLPEDATFALVHLDCDLYAPMLAALEYFYPRMAPGGFMLVHDYSSLAWEGAERAADLFFADKPESLVPMPDGCGTAIARRARPAGGPSWRDRQAHDVYGAGLEAGTRAADALFASGWSGAEPWGRWGIGQAHELALPAGGPVGHAPGGPCVLELHAEALVCERQPVAEVTVLADGETVALLRFADGQRRIDARIPLPAGARRVEFRPASWASPAALGLGADDRPLGMAVHRVRVVAG